VRLLLKEKSELTSPVAAVKFANSLVQLTSAIKDLELCIKTVGILPGYFNSNDEWIIYNTKETEVPHAHKMMEQFSLPCELPIRLRSKYEVSVETMKNLFKNRRILFFGNSVTRGLMSDVARYLGWSEIPQANRVEEKMYCEKTKTAGGSCGINIRDLNIRLFFGWMQW
jgi:hypothetical protein